MLRICFLLLSLLIVPQQFAYASVEDMLQQAVDAYASGQEATERNLRIDQFKRAQQLFQNVIEQGVDSAELQGNLGNAALQAEDLGVAVLAYRRALQRNPNHAQAQQNLSHVRSLLPSWVPRPSDDSVLDSFFFWHQAMPSAQRGGAGAACFLLAALGFAVAIRWRSALARNLALLPLLLWLGLTASVVFEFLSNAQTPAVITLDETIARASDSVNAAKRFSEALPAGTEVNVIEVRDRWAKISLSNGRSAWVSRFNLAFVDVGLN